MATAPTCTTDPEAEKRFPGQPSSGLTIGQYRHPVLFYVLATAIPWAFWFAAAYVSHMTPTSQGLAMATGVLSVAGLMGPAAIAFWLIWPHADLRRDIRRRLIGIRRVRPIYLFLACCLMLASILLAQAISLLFGHSVHQFGLSTRSSFWAGLLPGWFMIFLAPLVEELAWHSYGTDCLRQRMSLLSASLLFGVYWVIWHMPLSLIKGYYHSHLAESGWLYSLNFAISLFPFVMLMNWLYYRSHRSLLVVIVFHITAGLFNEIFATHPASKVIQSGLLLLLTLGVIAGNKDFFLRREYREEI